MIVSVLPNYRSITQYLPLAPYIATTAFDVSKHNSMLSCLPGYEEDADLFHARASNGFPR